MQKRCFYRSHRLILLLDFLISCNTLESHFCFTTFSQLSWPSASSFSLFLVASLQFLGMCQSICTCLYIVLRGITNANNKQSAHAYHSAQEQILMFEILREKKWELKERVVWGSKLLYKLIHVTVFWISYYCCHLSFKDLSYICDLVSTDLMIYLLC